MVKIIEKRKPQWKLEVEEDNKVDSKLHITFISDSKGEQLFDIATEDKIPKKKKSTKKMEKTKTRKDVCDICGSKTKSGHVKCNKCGQWKHIKCVGITIREAETKGYKCRSCK